MASTGLTLALVFVFILLRQYSSAASRLTGSIFNLTQAECGVAKESPLDKIHILRIPKASSTSLSVVARRYVGCVPAGPCCKFPGDPPGSCPDRGLFSCQKERRVIGCTNHYPMHGTLEDLSIPSISIMREPMARSVSAFFYPGSHHNNCTGDMDDCFSEYLRNPRWNNVVVKMLTGQYAYSTLPTCRFKSQCEHSLELACENLKKVVVMGVAEMWELTLMLMHCKLRRVNPTIDEFRLSKRAHNTTGTTAYQHFNTFCIYHNCALFAAAVGRINTKPEYATFYRHAIVKFHDQLYAQNELDIELYQLVLRNFHRELVAAQLWKHRLVQEYWNHSGIKF